MRKFMLKHYNIEDLAGKKIESEHGTKAIVVHVKANLHRIEPKSQIVPTLEKYKGSRIYCRVLTEEEWKDDEL